MWSDPCHVFCNIYVMRIKYFYEFYLNINKVVVFFDWYKIFARDSFVRQKGF